MGDVRSDPTGAVERGLERLLRLSVGRAGSARQSALVGAEVSRAGYSVLRTLADQGPLPLGELARECAMDPGAAVRQVQALEGEALVERVSVDHDARVRQVALTARGTDVERRLVGLRLAYVNRVLDGWSTSDRAHLAEMVERLVEAFLTTQYPVEDAN